MADKKNGSGAPARARTGPSGGRPLYAAVDLGTNNCRLLVAEPWGKTFRVVDSHSQIARLGEGLHETGRLSDAAIDRAMDALHAIRRKLRHHGVGRVRCIATEACRKAANGMDFIRRVHEETGLTFKVIGAKEEARLAAIGCHDLLAPPAASVMVIDIGGGSTELSHLDASTARQLGLKGLLDRAPILDWTSLKLGVVTLTDAFAALGEENAWPDMVSHARQTVAAWPGLEAAKARLVADEGYLIGTSGTVTCLAGVHLNLDRYRRDRVDGSWMSEAEGLATIERLRSLGTQGRAKLPTIGEERAPLMPAGCAILFAVWEAFSGSRLRIADRGLREGLLLSMMYGKPGRRRRGGRGGRRGRAPQSQQEGQA
ncbi:Ppx/GppA phosphatase family protein [Hyphomonas sp.]|uniref:Ppx/GppA phosphatase family protein n=1 Tax=Hyphomonas sp. TaxID=87 RepID=UPI00391DECC9